ncbi:MAG: beta-N-acetylhexosaminidase [Ferruginibacter sp.]
MKGIFFLLAMIAAVQVEAQDKPVIIPEPVSVILKEGKFILDNNTIIMVNNKSLLPCAELLNSLFKAQNKPALKITTTTGTTAKKRILLKYADVNQQTAEAYQLDVSKNAITITGKSAGIFYGIQTFIQLVDQGDSAFPGRNSTFPIKPFSLTIPSLSITDYPRFSYRGMHLDVSRHFFSVEQVKRYIDFLAAYKFNVFHWHLTDDQGWRIEIKKYPKLTSVGAYRNGTIIGPYPGTGNDNIHYGGYYSQEEIKDIVRYASSKYISIIPEIEMLGHSSAAIAAYPQLSCFPGEDSPIPPNTAWSGTSKGKQVQQSWGVFDDVLCPTDYTFQFLEDVLDEVMQLFPSPYIHIGGDECPKTYWKRSAFCQQLMQDKKLKDEHALQSYFIQRIEQYINSKGKKIIGWDEILEGGLAPNAAVMSWQGEQGGIAAARLDHDVIMCPQNPLYLNHAQSNDEDSVTQGGYNPIENVYAYDPIPKEITVSEARHILGAQGNMWSEHIHNEKKLEYMLFPRIAALSEVLWTQKGKRDWPAFEKKLPLLFKRLTETGINYSKAYYNIKASVLPGPENGSVLWQLESKSPDARIVYDVSGRETGTLYIAPIMINRSCIAKAVLANDKQQTIGNWLIQDFHFNKATGKTISLSNPASGSYPGDGAFTLVNGIRNRNGLQRSSEFLGFSGTDMEATIDLGQQDTVSRISLHVLVQEASWIYAPSSVTTRFSTDGKNYSESISLLPVNAVYGAKLSAPVSCRYIRILATNNGIIAAGKPGAGNPAWLFCDEIEAE